MGQTGVPTSRPKPLINSDRVEGTAVFAANGHRIGTIKRLVIEKVSGRVVYVMISFGGFLGFGDQVHAIPWEELDYDPTLGGYRTDVTEDQIRSSPNFLHDEHWSDREREKDVHEHFHVPPYWLP
jgi:hypothetical protein